MTTAERGALETVIPEETGLLVADPGAEAMADAIVHAFERRFDSCSGRAGPS